MKKDKTFDQSDSGKRLSRRKFITATGLVAGGMLSSRALASVGAKSESTAAAPPLPWSWAKLDPQEAGERTFRIYHEKGG